MVWYSITALQHCVGCNLVALGFEVVGAVCGVDGSVTLMALVYNFIFNLIIHKLIKHDTHCLILALSYIF